MRKKLTKIDISKMFSSKLYPKIMRINLLVIRQYLTVIANLL